MAFRGNSTSRRPVCTSRILHLWGTDRVDNRRALRAAVRRGMRVRISRSEITALERKAYAIEDRFEEHYRKALRHAGQAFVQKIRSRRIEEDDASEDEEDEVLEGDDGSDWYRSFKCLWWLICVPSIYTRKEKDKKHPYARLEAKLRHGQLNQVVRSLRGSINQKYFWCQAKQRKGGTKKDREKYDQNAQQMQDSINNLRRSYMDIRKALIFLEPEAAIQYKVLTAADVRIPSWMAQLNSRHARDAQNSWIWQEYNEALDTDQGGECKWLLLVLIVN